MSQSTSRIIQQSSLFLLFMTLLTGVFYPLLIWGIDLLLFKKKSLGELIEVDGQVRGARNIGQKFSSNWYFWGRPSAIDYKAESSGASQLAPTASLLKENIAKYAELYEKTEKDIPPELILSSGSGLDPHISPQAALFQLPRVMHARNVEDSEKVKIEALIKKLSEEADLGLFGRKRINVLMLNIELDKVLKKI